MSLKVGKKAAIEIGDDGSVKVGKKLTIEAHRRDEPHLRLRLDHPQEGRHHPDQGQDVVIDGSGKINVKASSDVTIKGSTINQN